MSKGPILKCYVSPIDQFLLKLAQTYPNLSTSQQKEINKYNRINYLRDSMSGTDETNLPEWF